MNLNNNWSKFQKNNFFSKNLLQYNFHKIRDKNKIKNYLQVIRKFFHKYLKKK